jgi:hypothetical protein
LEAFAGPAAEVARSTGADPGDLAREFVTDDAARRHFASDVVPSFCSAIESFWHDKGAALHEVRTRLPGTRALFGGDVGPQASDRLFSSAGLYFDTIVVHDPLLRIVQAPFRPEEQPYYLLKYAITQLLLRDVYLADVWPPIALLVPDRNLFVASPDNDSLHRAGQIDSVLLLNRLYEKTFDDLAEAEAFFFRFSTAEELIREAKQPDLFLFSNDAPHEPGAQLETLVRDGRRLVPREFLPDDPKIRDRDLVWRGIQGRFQQVTDIISVAHANQAHPILTASVSFHWMAMKLELNREFAEAALGLPDIGNLKKTNALLAAPLSWLANVPLDALVELRRRGQLSDLRKLIGGEIDGLSDIPLDDLDRVAREIDHKLAEAIAAHQDKAEALDASFRSDLKIPGLTLLGSVAVALEPGLAPIIPAFLSKLAGIVGVGKLTEIAKASARHFRERKSLGQTPVGILWKARTQKK